MTTTFGSRAAGAATLGRLIGRGFGFLAQLVLARLLAPEAFGLFAIGWTLLRLSAVAGHLGLDSGVIRFASAATRQNDSRLRGIIATAVLGGVLSGLLLAAALILAAPWIATSLFREPELAWVLRGLALAFPLANASRVLAAASTISGKMLCSSISEDTLQPTAQIALFLLMYRLGFGLQGAVAATVMSYAISALACFACVRRFLPQVFAAGGVTWPRTGRLLRFSLTAMLGGALGALGLWGDRLLVGYFGTTVDAGIYQSVSLVTMVSVMVISGLKTVVAPWIAALHSQGENQEATIALQRVSRWGLYVSLPVLLVTVIFPSEVLNLLFGAAYASGASALVWLAIGQLFYVCLGGADQFFLMTGRQKDWLAISGFTLVVIVVLDMVMIPRLGIVGAAIVSCATTALVTVLGIARLREVFGFWLVGRQHLAVALAALIASVPAALLARASAIPDAIRLALGGVLIAAVFGVALWAIGLHPDDRRAIKRLLARGDAA